MSADSPATSDPRIGTVIGGRFRIDQLLGEGQMAKVYLAEQLSMQRKVALKLLHADLAQDPTAPVRLAREVEAVARLKSQHTIVFYDCGKDDDGTLFIVMELLEGETLRTRLMKTPRLPAPLALEIVAQICDCLTEAHEAGILHRDLKPENVFLCPRREELLVKVLDFGLAKMNRPGQPGAQLTAPRTTVGTPAYLAPEMAVMGRKIDTRADLYALGVMTFEMLVGRRPFLADNPILMVEAHIYDPVPRASGLNRDLPRGSDFFFDAVLAKDPNRRPPNARAFADALKTLLD